MNYIALWDEMQEKARLQKKDDGIWNKLAKQYASHTKYDRTDRVAWQLSEMSIPEGATVLDVGAGTGALAYPLKEAGAEVTVLEPTEAMREHLQGFPLIPAAFETAELSKEYDYVITSFSFFFKDFEKSIRKMNRAANREVHIFWFLKTPSRGVEELWQILHNEPYAGDPDAEILVKALEQMGIHPTVTTFNQTRNQMYPDKDALLNDYYLRLLAKTDEQKEIIAEYLLKRAEITPDGYCLKIDAPAAHVWWKKTDIL
ncbi:MAG TPA: class I SAM-dependent methyltransferase [Methanocorpusculum sp.]|nr:class I SAM-dependent methyltransferase [Methanocorpusculum sp.]